MRKGKEYALGKIGEETIINEEYFTETLANMKRIIGKILNEIRLEYCGGTRNKKYLV